MEEKQLADLEAKAKQIRFELLQMFGSGKHHHFGGSLSCVEILTALYFYKMNYSFEQKDSLTRDRFIMSKGHSVPTQYVILSMLGFFPSEELGTIKQLGSILQGHPDINKTPGIEAPTGSLGQGLSYANGIALAARLDGNDFNIYVVMGDGELQSGQVWEAAMTTSHYRINNMRAIIDLNGYQSQGCVQESLAIEPLEEKWRSFGWRATRINGHDMVEVCRALDETDNIDKPCIIIAETVKGKGISAIEGTFRGHNYALTEEEYKNAYDELAILNGEQE
jgi:transketolase